MNEECVGCKCTKICITAVQPGSVMCQIYRMRLGQTKAEQENERQSEQQKIYGYNDRILGTAIDANRQNSVSDKGISGKSIGGKSGMRKILFKAKRADNGEWVEGIPIHTHIGWFICFEENPHFCHQYGYMEIDGIVKVDEDTICQYTGLTDRNGKKIWENDIVDGHIKRGAAFVRCLVLWSNTKARFDVRAMDCDFPMTLDECVDDISICGSDYEIVGNVFDNPELLKGGAG